MKNKALLITIVGLFSFISLMLGGCIWLLGLVGVSGGIFNTLNYISNIVLILAVLIAGWVWLVSTKMNKTLKIVLQVLFVIFAVLAICGIFGIGF